MRRQRRPTRHRQINRQTKNNIESRSKGGIFIFIRFKNFKSIWASPGGNNLFVSHSKFQPPGRAVQGCASLRSRLSDETASYGRTLTITDAKTRYQKPFRKNFILSSFRK